MKRLQQSPSYQAKLSEERALELIELEEIQRINEIENEKWIQCEIRVNKEWQEKKLKLEEQARKREIERQRIQNEFEQKQKRIADAIEEKKRRAAEEKRLHADLQQKIQEYINCDGDVPIELLQNAETNPGKEICTFFMKTATCRFGNKCVRNHIRPRISKVLMIPAFFTNIYLGQNKTTEYGSDATLEMDEKELYDDFKEFFSDVLIEFQKIGRISHFVVCHNYEPYLRGNVYIEYSNERYDIILYTISK